MNKVSSKAHIMSNVKIGYYTVIEENVQIGKNSTVGNNVTIYRGTIIGENVRIDDNTVIGKQPMRAVTSAISDGKEQIPANIGDGSIIGTSSIIYAGCNIGRDCLIADLSTVRENVTIGDKTIIGRGVAIENYCEIGSYCKLETNAYITSYSKLEDYVFIAPGVVTSNDNFAGRTKERFKHFKGVTIKRGGRIGAQVTILPGKTIEEDGFVGAGSVVTKNVPKEKIMIGNPIREISNVSEEQLLKNNI
ncbi:acyl-(acyl-carrier-protein)-UDP-N- acetylglucosamine acyltransferase [Gottschalkia purinilytica]|uniref:Acyl-(Acyl-carrier-protein)-UDP-N-acetylglucosamine acyltransferase n=1 Tax=Gottschalkia purinilytica TaxID=1503 RepID=A0A0L0WDU4_GOTPU|nr:acyltransferase [Gottschalkia purinilytica]KNF09644.1 acyl-(acyl-carrier-protein)-UDP-N- acetylglucosamine acyltransferase [Gottschalkia purinilytica]